MNQAKETGPRFSISARINLTSAGFPFRVFKRSTFNVQRSTFNCSGSELGVGMLGACRAVALQRRVER